MSRKESVYMQCGAALDRLIKADEPEFFTELDVITEAATTKWRNGEYTKALHQANEICGSRYRKRKVCRYGPVVIGKGNDKIEDYARFAGKIVYADAVKGPDYLETPNGKFRKMMIEDDEISKQGRKPAANRDDAAPWSEQALPAKPRKPTTRKRPSVNSEDRDLKKMVSDLQKRVKVLEQEREEERAFFSKKRTATAV